MFNSIEELEKEIELFHKNISDSNELIIALENVTTAIREMNNFHNNILEKTETTLQTIPEKLLCENSNQQSELITKIKKMNDAVREDNKKDYTTYLNKIATYNKNAENLLKSLSALVNQLSDLKESLLNNYHKENKILKSEVVEHINKLTSSLDSSIAKLTKLQHDILQAISNEKSSINDISEQLKSAIKEISDQKDFIAKNILEKSESRLSKIESKIDKNSADISELNKSSENMLNDIRKGNKTAKRNFTIIISILICILLIVSFLLVNYLFSNSKNISSASSTDVSQVLNGNIASMDIGADIDIPLNYTGSLKDNMPDGKGTYKWNDGTSYTGNWLAGKADGDGVFTSSSCKLKGIFSKNKLISGSATMYGKNVEVKFNVSNGVVDYSNVTVTFNDSTTYNGEWNKGITGNGIITFANGDTYAGSFQLGKFNGSGTYTWKNGSSYDGNWSENMMNGKGTYYYNSNKSRYINGKFKSNKPVGQLKYIYKNHEYTTIWNNGQCSEIKS